MEIEPPTGVLRIPIHTQDDITTARVRAGDGARLIGEDLRKAATTLDQPTIGPLFQALLCRNAIDTAGGPSGAMYANRDDRAGGAELDLDPIANQVPSLSKRSAALVQLLRIKLEDDGDLEQASKTLRDIGRFFEQLDEACAKCGMTAPDALVEMRM